MGATRGGLCRHLYVSGILLCQQRLATTLDAAFRSTTVSLWPVSVDDWCLSRFVGPASTAARLQYRSPGSDSGHGWPVSHCPPSHLRQLSAAVRRCSPIAPYAGSRSSVLRLAHCADGTNRLRRTRSRRHLSRV